MHREAQEPAAPVGRGEALGPRWLWQVAEAGRMGKHSGLTGGDRRCLILSFWNGRNRGQAEVLSTRLGLGCPKVAWLSAHM